MILIVFVVLVDSYSILHWHAIQKNLWWHALGYQCCLSDMEEAHASGPQLYKTTLITLRESRDIIRSKILLTTKGMIYLLNWFWDIIIYLPHVDICFHVKIVL